MKKVLITGGAGYIGAHMIRVLSERGYKPVVFDNFSTGYRDYVPAGVTLIKGDLRNPGDIQKVFKKYKICAVMHFAAAIVVSESVSNPLKYYEDNVVGFVNLLKAMVQAGVDKIIFSSSACVYGNPLKNPITEDEPLKVENPYGATKIMAEQILRDLARAGYIKFIILRYFNVAGAGFLRKTGVKRRQPTHLIPSIMSVVSGRKKSLCLFGIDYPTSDGSCIRDYVHVLDICDAHLAALKALCNKRVVNDVFNLGNGKGFSVKEVIAVAGEVTGKVIRVRVMPRRSGDCPNVVASFSKAKRILGWVPKRGLKDIIQSMYNRGVK